MTLNDEKLGKERSFVVAKDNRLITKSRYSLTLQQQKILLYLISRIKPTDEVGTVYELPISDFIKVCGYDNAYYYKSSEPPCSFKYNCYSGYYKLNNNQ